MNKSKTYVLPLMEEYVETNYIIIKYLINTYMYCYLYDIRLTNVLVLEFDGDFVNRTDFTKHKNKLKSSELFVYCGIHRDLWYCIFNLPKKFIDDIKFFQLGKYSFMSKAAQTLILRHIEKYYPHRKEKSKLIWKILKKDVSLKVHIEKVLGTSLSDDAELCDKALKGDETILLKQ